MYVLRKLYHGEHVDVDEVADFTTLHEVVRNGYLLAVQRGATEDDLRCLAEYLDDLDSKMEMAAQAAQSPGPGGGGMPQAALAPAASAGPVAFDSKTP
jgi:hypothetical protein